MSTKHAKKDYFLLYGDFLIYSLVSVFSKIAAAQESLAWTMLFMFIEFCFLGVYALIWQQALKRFPLTVAMASKGITVILALLWSVALFRESISIMNVVGAALIILGIRVVSSDD